MQIEYPPGLTRAQKLKMLRALRVEAGLCRRCGGRKEPGRERLTSCAVCVRREIQYRSPEEKQRAYVEYRARSRREAKTAALEKYGGVCRCCGERGIAFLTFHHVDGAGNDDRRQGTSETFYRALLANPIRPDLTVLCWNCHFGVHYSPTRTCPHVA